MTSDEKTYVDREVEVDFGEEEDDDTPPWYIPPGNYPMRVFSAVLKEGKKADYIELVYDTLKDGKFRKYVRDRLSLSRRALWKLRRTRKALGLPAKGQLKVNLDEMLSRWAVVTVEDSEYRGRTQADVRDISILEDEIPQEWVDLLNTQAASQEEEEEWGEGEDVGTGYAQAEPAAEEETPFDEATGAEDTPDKTVEAEGTPDDEEDELPW